jgi:hypothetical protein
VQYSFFDKNTRQLVEKEFNKSPHYKHVKWDSLGIDTELYGKAMKLKTLIADSNTPDITFVPFQKKFIVRFVN